jgi:hypothetical protein
MGITNIHNYSMNFSNFRKIYLDSLPLIVKFTSSAGLFTGVYANMIKNNNGNGTGPYINEITTYSNLIGYTTVGMITGVTYPISFPLLAYYAFYNNVSQDEPNV